MRVRAPRFGARRLSILAAVLFCAVTVPPAVAELPPPSTSPPEFRDRPFGPKPPPTPPRPSVVRSESPERLPRSWILGGAAFGALIGGGLLFFAFRAWRMARIFGRQYRFPVPAKVAVRLGGERSGGLMATTRFATSGQTAGAESKAKDG